MRDAVAGGADGLAMAGGDGSQAVVAAIAAELDLPYACIPAGTRNHFALDLGVDRDDVVGALDAFVDGGERRVDLAEVNGRVFVNNVSLGLYADAVQREGYRDAKLRTILDTVPEVLGPDGHRARPALDRARAGTSTASGAAILVSNNRYRLGRAVGSGTRPRIDDGLLGITVARPHGGGDGTAAATVAGVDGAGRFEVEADHPVPAGIDGEAVQARAAAALPHPPPASCACASRRQHPGASPSATAARGLLGHAPRALARIAAGAIPLPAEPTTKETLMDIFEVEQKERLSREEVAARLRNLADMLARHNDIEFERGGMHIHGPRSRRGQPQDRARGRERRARAGDRADLVTAGTNHRKQPGFHMFVGCGSMTYVIVGSCIKDDSCVEVCPVDCIHPKPGAADFETAEQLYIDPEVCIDCDACVEACPVDAIFPEAELPEKFAYALELNGEFFAEQSTVERTAA